MNLLKKWWFWIILLGILVFLILFYAPLKTCILQNDVLDQQQEFFTTRISYISYWLGNCHSP